jgi:hypothetical protein
MVSSIGYVVLSGKIHVDKLKSRIMIKNKEDRT